jgi:hypothetical protein
VDGWVIVDNGGGDRRALSVACGIRDALRIPRIFVPGLEEPGGGHRHDPPCPWLAKEVREGRAFVIN